ncbi:unnamed protein product [Rotaria socialis]|uniref:Uncharacterized protein n=1 Tax=Rotaria socialis TaxID=392032 RepID=A0A818EFB7_9BILA|nr:unnamed protein product [Rotaria socialis]CAF3369297.1 unnamed protein product [Rotaria socialis]CAF3458109.1 unnamed protein product [Rotaria socialis]CAF3468748.1 unnamed protein product [Rotaria socialis]CAF3776367.1 unnamed protein product [Rotaria socialis]
MYGAYNQFGNQNGFGGYTSNLTGAGTFGTGFGGTTGYSNFATPNYFNFATPRYDGYAAPTYGTGYDALGAYGRFFSSPYGYGTR